MAANRETRTGSSQAIFAGCAKFKEREAVVALERLAIDEST